MTVDYTQFDAETPLSGEYVSPTWERDTEEQDVAEQLAHAFIAGVLVAKAWDWSGLSKKWSERGYRDGDLQPLRTRFVSAFKKAAGDSLVRAAGIGRTQALADFQVEFGRQDWKDVASTWASVYGNEMAAQVADQSHKALGDVIPQLLNMGMRNDPLIQTAKRLYGLDPRSMASAMTFMTRKDKPRNETILSLAEKLLTRRATVIGDVQGFTGLNFGRQLTYLEAMDSGLLPKSARKVWVTALDERVCKICKPMDGVSVGLMDTFAIPTSSGTIRLLVPPVHPNCRCTVVPEERYRHGIITRRARFRDEGPSHRGRLRSEVEDLVRLGKSEFWEEVKHPRDDNGKFTAGFKHAVEGAAVTGVAAYTLLHPALRARVNIMRMPAAEEAWTKIPSMRHFPGRVQYIRANNPEVNAQIKRLHSLDDPSHEGKQVLFHPDAYQHLQGENLAETLQKVEEFIKDKHLEHSAVMTPQGKILSMGRGTTGSAPVWLPTFLPRRAKGNLIFTHNHPDAGVAPDVLHTLSAQDVIALHSHGIGRARAVTPRGGFFDIQTNPDATSEQLQKFAGAAANWAVAGQDEAIPLLIDQHYGVGIDRARKLYEEYGQHEMFGTPFGPPSMASHIDGMMAGYQAQRMHEFYQEMAKVNPDVFRYNHGQHAFVQKFSPLQARDAIGRFAPVAAAAAGAYVAATNFPKVKDEQPKLPSHLRRVDRKVKSVKSGTYIVPRQYLDFHQRGQSFRMGNEAHISDMAREMRQQGYKMKPVTLHVYDNAVDVADGNHRVEAAYRAKLGFIPTKIVRFEGNKPRESGVIPAWRQRRTTEARRLAASRYVGSLEQKKPNPFRRLNQRLIAQDERKHQWHDKSRKRTIRPL